MIAVYIISGILLFLLILLFIPVSADMIYEDKFSFSIKYGGVKVFDSTKQKTEKLPKPGEDKPQEKEQEKPKKENFLTKTFNKKGKIEGVKFLAQLIKIALSRIIWVIRKVKFRKFFLSIGISSDNAANTAIAYGAVCAAVYPIINLLDLNTNFSVKEVNIYTDFDKLSPEIKASIYLSTRLIYAVIAFISFGFAYLKLKKESDKNG